MLFRSLISLQNVSDILWFRFHSCQIGFFRDRIRWFAELADPLKFLKVQWIIGYLAICVNASLAAIALHGFVIVLFWWLCKTFQTDCEDIRIDWSLIWLDRLFLNRLVRSFYFFFFLLLNSFESLGFFDWYVWFFWSFCWCRCWILCTLCSSEKSGNLLYNTCIFLLASQDILSSRGNWKDRFRLWKYSAIFWLFFLFLSFNRLLH